MPTIQVPEDAREFGHATVKAETTNHLSEEVFFARSGVLRSVYYEKPADVDLLVELHVDTDPSNPGPVIKLGNIVAADNLADGAISAGRPVLKQDGSAGSKLVITTSGGSSGDKIVTPIVSPADVGV